MDVSFCHTGCCVTRRSVRTTYGRTWRGSPFAAVLYYRHTIPYVPSRYVRPDVGIDDTRGTTYTTVRTLPLRTIRPDVGIDDTRITTWRYQNMLSANFMDSTSYILHLRYPPTFQDHTTYIGTYLSGILAWNKVRLRS